MELKGFGCFTWLGLMFVALVLEIAYSGLNGQEPTFIFVLSLALPLIIVSMLINRRIERRFNEEKERERARDDEQSRKDFEERQWLERVNPEEARRRDEKRRLDENTQFCSYCRMRIPRGASICPYCRSKLTP